MKMNLIIRNLPQEDWTVGPKLAKAFQRDYPDHPLGFSKFVVYELLGKYYLVYKTKTATVVRDA